MQKKGKKCVFVCVVANKQTSAKVFWNTCTHKFLCVFIYFALCLLFVARHEETRFVICISNFRACQVRDVLTGAFTTTHCPQSNRPHRPECTQLQFNWRDIFLLCAFGTFLHHLNILNTYIYIYMLYYEISKGGQHFFCATNSLRVSRNQ